MGRLKGFMRLIPRLNSGDKRKGELKIIVRVIVDLVEGGGEWVDGWMEGGVLFAGRAKKREKEKKKGKNQRKKNKKKNTIFGGKVSRSGYSFEYGKTVEP